MPGYDHIEGVLHPWTRFYAKGFCDLCTVHEWFDIDDVEEVKIYNCLEKVGILIEYIWSWLIEA